MNAETLLGIAQTFLTVRVGEVSLGPGKTSILVLALAAALLSGFHLWRIGRHERRQTRLAALRGRTLDRAPVMRRLPWYRRLGNLVAASPMVGTAEQRRLLGVLAAAGIKGHGGLSSFVGNKVCGALGLAAVSWILLEWQGWFAGTTILRLIVIAVALMLGWRLPDFILARLAARRRLRLEQGMPDALDLLVICAEAGLSLNQAIEEIGRDLRPSSPDVAEEFAATAAEMRVLPDVGQALDNLTRRTGLADLRGLVATLKQALKFGTPLADSMRILAADMRAARQARIEERTARLPVLLAVPMSLFIFPCLMIVIATPVGLRIYDTLGHLLTGTQ